MKNTQPSLSIALAIYNEAHNIISCLDSCYDMADEIIIVDGESTDGSVELIKKYDREKKIKIIEASNPLMFHINKQKALDKCTKDWILQLDADEHLSEDLKLEILDLQNSKLKTQNSNDPVAYWIPRINYFLGRPLKKGGQYPDYTIRFYKNGVAHFPCKTVHEQVEITGEIGYLAADLLHYPFPTFDAYLDKWDRYSTQEAQLLFKKGKKPTLGMAILYFIIKPKVWFLKTYFRHKGFMDGFPGFVFSLFSAIQNWAIFVKLWELSH